MSGWISVIIYIILGYFAVLWVGYFVLLIASASTILRKFKESDANSIIYKLNEASILPITIILPAFNEEKRILNAIDSIFQSQYQLVNIVIVNDGSTDNTLRVLLDKYQMKEIPPAFQERKKTGKVLAYYQSQPFPNVMVVNKEHSPFANSGADCINAGLNVCRTPLFITLDADTLLEPDALSRMLFTYLTHEHCVAIGGDIYVPDSNPMKRDPFLERRFPINPILGVQVCEYLRSFIYGREGWTLIGGSLCHPGAFTLLETQAVWEVGAYDAYNFSYDAEIILKLHEYMRKKKFPYSIIYAPSAIAWSEEPRTLKQFWLQRSNWQRGLLRCLALHKGMLFNPKYGITGMLSFPFYVLFEIFGPVVEAISYIVLIIVLYLGVFPIADLVWVLLLAWGCMILSIMTYNKYYKKTDILRVFILTTMDMYFYRQFRSVCALFSSLHYVFNRLRGKAE